MDTKFTIQQAARETGLSVHTLRYYERIGLISPVCRADNGHRRYTEDDLGWIEFLKKLRTTGMPIADMKRFVELTRQGDGTIPERRALLESHYHMVRARIQELRDNLAVIEHKIHIYSQVEA